MTSPPLTGPTAQHAPRGSVTAPNAAEQQERCRMLLEQFNDWLQRTAPKTPHLARIVPMAIQAVHLYRAGRFEESIGKVEDAAEILRLTGHTPPLSR